MIVSRVADNEKAILVSFSRELTNDEIRAFHDFIRLWATSNIGDPIRPAMTISPYRKPG